MRKCLACFLLLFLTAGAATAAVTKGDFERAVDVLKCRAVSASLQASSDFRKVADEYSQTFNCDGLVQSSEIDAFLSRQTGLEKTADMAREIDSIRSEFNPQATRTSVIGFLTGSVFDDSRYPSLNAFKVKRKGQEFDRFIAQLSRGLNGQLPPDVSGTPASDPIPGGGERVPEPSVMAQLLSSPWLAAFSMTGAALGLAYLFYRFRLVPGLRDQIKRLDRRIDGVNKDKQSSGLPPQVMPAASDEGLKRHLSKLEGRIASVEALVDEMGSRQTSRSSPSYRFEERSNVGGDSRSEVFYLSTPNSDGTFDARAAQRDFRESASIYKFTHTSPTLAVFEVANDEAAVKLALLYPDRNIEPVCESENAFDRDVRRIITASNGAGRAELVGDKWHVRQKLRIIYGY